MPSIGLADLLTALRQRWWLVLVVALPLVLLVQRYAESLPDEYESFAVVSLTLEADVSVSSDLIRLEVQRYAVTLASPETTRSLAAELLLDPEQLEDSVEVTTPPDTGNIRIGVAGGTPDLPARIANRLATRGEAEALDDPTLRAVVSARAVPATEPSGPARGMIVAVGVFLGLLSGAALVMLVERLRPRVHGLGTMARHAREHRVLGRAALAPAGRWPRPRADDVPSAVRRVEALASLGSIGTIAVVGTTDGAGTEALISGFAHPAGAVEGRARSVDGVSAAQSRRSPAPEGATSRFTRGAEPVRRLRVRDGGNVHSATAHVCLADADGVVLLVRRGSALSNLHAALELLDERQAVVVGMWLTTPRSLPAHFVRRAPAGSTTDELEPSSSQAVRTHPG